MLFAKLLLETLISAYVEREAIERQKAEKERMKATPDYAANLVSGLPARGSLTLPTVVASSGGVANTAATSKSQTSYLPTNMPRIATSTIQSKKAHFP